MTRRKTSGAPTVAVWALVIGLGLAVAQLGVAPAEAGYYPQPGTCSGTYTNWRGDYTTGYDWFGKSYSGDTDCDRSYVYISYNGGGQDFDSDSTYSYIAVARSSYGQYSVHNLCWDIASYPYEACHTNHWLNL